MQTRQAGLEQTGEIVLRDLVKEALRMRPSRILVGEVRAAEVRAAECLDLLLALNSGLPGMATLHANSAREALVKMCTLPLSPAIRTLAGSSVICTLPLLVRAGSSERRGTGLSSPLPASRVLTVIGGGMTVRIANAA